MRRQDKPSQPHVCFPVRQFVCVLFSSRFNLNLGIITRILVMVQLGEYGKIHVHVAVDSATHF